MGSPMPHHAQRTQYGQQQHHQPYSSPPQLPSISSLTNGFPPSSQPSPSQPPRDSGAWVRSQSKHTSAASGLHVSTLLNSDEPSTRSSIPSTPTSSRISHASHTLPPMSEGRGQRESLQRDSLQSTPRDSDYYGQRDSSNFGQRESSQYGQRESNSYGQRESNQYGARPSIEQQGSRRSSIDSRVHSGIHSLALNPGMSPYESQHGSTVSLAASLRRPDGSSQHSPTSVRVPRSSDVERTRVAPPIVPNPRQYGAPDPTASRPTQGFPWAFPDDPTAITERSKRRASSSESSSEGHKMSRQGSYAASSVRSSALSGEQSLPPGQRRFEEGMGFQKIIGPVAMDLQSPTESPGLHPLMQHRLVTDLRQEHGSIGPGTGYSRSPELRVTHKLAERKRRSEMKDLFDDLNKAVPSNGGPKASKWEVLSKAIDHIKTQRDTERALHDELQRARQKIDTVQDVRQENDALRAELNAMYERLRRLEPSSPQVYGQHASESVQHNQPNGHQHPASNVSPQQQQQQQQQAHAHQNFSLPYSSMSHSAPMQGVEYALPTRPSGESR